MVASLGTEWRQAPEELLLGFTRALRAAGVPVSSDRAQGFLRAASVVGMDDRRATYWAGRATLCSGPEDLERYDQIFESWFLSEETRSRSGQRPERPPVREVEFAERQGEGEPAEDDTDELRALAAETEILRHRDVAQMDAAEKARLQGLFSALRPRAPRRNAQRRSPWHRGDVDAARTQRLMLARMGEPAEIAWRRRGQRSRRVVLLVDVSGSMSPYADALLRLAHTFVQVVPRAAARTAGGPTEGVEVFTVGTRLTHLTRAMRLRDPERAIVAASRTVPDWSGGTRLGETLKAFLDQWGQRGLARGAVVVLFSDGWERGDAALLGEQMMRLQRLAHRVIWANPHRGKEGYLPVQQGIVAALPYVDDFVAGHSMATFEDLIEVVAHA
ncbi:MAG TPA: VWA domain-containing protein [Nocardioidaceae bacterium]|nr:VWA domain-containing protein [Nocardioidaceae bacterium]